MPKYDRAVRFLMKDMVAELGLKQKSVLQKSKAIDWFRKYYPAIDHKTVECHLTRMSVNAPSRLHYNAIPKEDDLLFKIDSTQFRLFDPRNDPAPIWSEKQAPTIGNKKTKQAKNYETQISRLINNLDELHEIFYQAGVFTGPSLYFHGKAMETRGEKVSERHLEYIYATLVSWGMHRMGPGGSKMVNFSVFKNSTEDLMRDIKRATKIDCRDVSESDWGVLEMVFGKLKIMATGTSIVGNDVLP